MRLALTRPRLLVAALLLLAVVALIMGVVFPPHDSSAATITGSNSSVLLVGEFESTVTTLSAVQPSDPTQRQQLHTIEHAPGWDIVGAASPDGQRLAYLVLPPDARDPQTEAVLVLLDNLDRPDGPRTRTLFRGADLAGSLAWSSDGAALFVRTTTAGTDDRLTFELIEIDAANGEQRSLVRRNDVLGLYPVGRIGQGPTYSVAVGVNGSELLLINAASKSGEVEMRPLSRLVTRSWTLSPDGSQLAFTEQQGLDLRVRVASLTSDSAQLTVAAALDANGTDATVGTASPAWHPDGTLSVGTLGQGEGRCAHSACPGERRWRDHRIGTAGRVCFANSVVATRIELGGARVQRHGAGRTRRRKRSGDRCQRNVTGDPRTVRSHLGVVE